MTSVQNGQGFNLNWPEKTFSWTRNNSVVQPKRCKSKTWDKDYRLGVWSFLVKVLVGETQFMVLLIYHKTPQIVQELLINIPIWEKLHLESAASVEADSRRKQEMG